MICQRSSRFGLSRPSGKSQTSLDGPDQRGGSRGLGSSALDECLPRHLMMTRFAVGDRDDLTAPVPCPEGRQPAGVEFGVVRVCSQDQESNGGRCRHFVKSAGLDRAKRLMVVDLPQSSFDWVHIISRLPCRGYVVRQSPQC